MAVYQNPELLALFDTYTAGPGSIGANLTRMVGAAGAGDPLIVATGADMAIFPGDGGPPSVQSFRLSTRGFKELAGISHLGPALASLVRMHEIDPASTLWRAEAQRLLAATERARAANSPALWRDHIAVEAYIGREEAIADMLDYACGLTLRYLRVVLDDESKLTGAFLRHEFIEAKGTELGASVPFNAVMIATFFLTGLDISHRVTRWFKQHQIDWQRAMVLICGKQGRPTSGVTWTSNSVCQMIISASDRALPIERMYVAPHAPGFSSSDTLDPLALSAFEQSLRAVWYYTKAISELAPLMFDGYPGYLPGEYEAPVIGADTRGLAEMPRIMGPDDMLTLTTRLRIVIEDPRQLLSGCVTDYAAEQLRLNGNDYAKVIVPGLDGYHYPAGL